MSSRGLLRISGLVVSAVAVIWIATRFARSGALDLLAGAALSTGSVIAMLAAAAASYGLAMTLPGIAWWRLTTALSTEAPPARPIVAMYAVTQFGKYLPGNVAHYAFRHAWSRRYGLPHAGLGLASILEAALLLLASLALTLLGDTRQLRVLLVIDPRVGIAALVAMLLALGAALWFARRRNFAERWHIPALPRASALLGCLVCYVTFFVACAGILKFLAYPLGIGIDSFAMLLAASAASWAAGFIVVGAPGGLGVREAAFVALAGGALGESQALLLIGLFRIVTFLGDTLFFAAGALALRGAGDPSQTRSAP